MRLHSAFLIVAMCSAWLAIAASSEAVTTTWSAVGNPGNPADTAVMTDGTTGYGSVNYSYSIGTYDVTNSQYSEFLNARDPTGANPLGLYDPHMGITAANGGISFNASAVNGSKYAVISGAALQPMNWQSWYDAIRFANWMNNGQGNGDTESGSYTLQGGTPTPSNADSIVRNAGAIIVVPSENEWYKAAYYNPATNAYFGYPTSSNATPVSSSPTSLPNHVNFGAHGAEGPTNVGAYTGTKSPYGAFDMGGNAYQWNESLIGEDRGLRGGGWGGGLTIELQSIYRGSAMPDPGIYGGVDIGFRLAMVPEPSTLALATLGFAASIAWRWRRSAGSMFVRLAAFLLRLSRCLRPRVRRFMSPTGPTAPSANTRFREP
jgi:formylglycine-generating enzyme